VVLLKKNWFPFKLVCKEITMYLLNLGSCDEMTQIQGIELWLVFVFFVMGVCHGEQADSVI
jgi:hypothetical protein